MFSSIIFMLPSIYAIAASAVLVNSQYKWTTVDKRICPFLCGGQESKNKEFFRPHILFYFLISFCMVLYCHKKLGHRLGTKLPIIIVSLIALTREKVCICRGFRRLRFFDSTKIKTIFYLYDFVCEKKAKRL